MYLDIFKQIKWHPTFLLFSFLSFITGMIVEMLIIFSIVILHELGHYVAAKHYKWKIKRIIIWLFGGVLIVDESSRYHLKEDLFVTLFGPLQHVLVFIIASSGLFNENISHLIHYYNILILCFNLLPIWPLDGGRILFLIFTLLFPFKKAYKFIILFSVSAIFLLFLSFTIKIEFSLTILILSIFLLLENVTSWKSRYLKQLHFLLHLKNRAYFPTKVYYLRVNRKIKLNEIANHFVLNKHHVILVKMKNKAYSIDEQEFIQSFFNPKYMRVTVEDYLLDVKKSI